MKKTASGFNVILLCALLMCQQAAAFEFGSFPESTGGAWLAPVHKPTEPLDDKAFPIVHYLFGNVYIGPSGFWHDVSVENQFYKTRSQDEIAVPVYVGYVVVDANFRYAFVDKFNGLAPEIPKAVDRLNSMAPDSQYRRSAGQAAPRWSWQGYIFSKEELLRIARRVVTTYRVPPDDDWALRDAANTYEMIFNAHGVPRISVNVNPDFSAP